MFYNFRNRFGVLLTVFIAAISLFASACSSSDSSSSSASSSGESTAEKFSIVVTTNILGDVVTNTVGDLFDVEIIMPPGADPHVFQASAQQVNQMMEADLLVVNGANFEEGLLDVIEAAESDGVMIFEAIGSVDVIESDDHDDHDEEGHDDHDEEGHDDHDEEGDDDHDDHDEEGDDDHDEEGHDDHDDHDDHDEEGDDDHDEEGHDDHDEEGDDDHDDHDEEGHEGHDHGGIDPHFFTDPARMANVVEALTAFLVQNFPTIDQDALLASSNAYLGELTGLDAEVEEILSSIPEESRGLITNHSVFAYFVDRYGFNSIG